MLSFMKKGSDPKVLLTNPHLSILQKEVLETLIADQEFDYIVATEMPGEVKVSMVITFYQKDGTFRALHVGSSKILADNIL